uniref:PA domain-containing protein n=1 Tax=Panagrolaimus sp. ES5 TaxID=591445 RepID=A0AC34FLJ6_9BILA
MGDKFDPSQPLPRRVVIDPDEIMAEEITRKYNSACPNVASQYRTSDELTHFGTTIRSSVKKLLGNVFDSRKINQDETCQKTNERLRAWAFSTTNSDHLQQLKSMGIEVQIDTEGRVMLIHRASAIDDGGPPIACFLEPDDPTASILTQFSQHFFFKLWNTSNQAALTAATVILVMFCLWVVLLLTSIILVCTVSVIFKFLKLGPFKITDSTLMEASEDMGDDENEDSENEDSENIDDGGPPIACFLEPDDPTASILTQFSQHFFFKLWNTSNQAALTAATVILVMFCLWVVLLLTSIILVCTVSVIFKFLKWGPFKITDSTLMQASEDMGDDDDEKEDSENEEEENAKSVEFENLGLTFMKEMLEFNKQQENELLNLIRVERSVQVLSAPVYGKADYPASNAQFGLNLNTSSVIGSLALASPLQSCSPLKNARQLEGKIVLVRRGGCMFQEKARFAQTAGAIGVIVADNQEDSSFATAPLFSMSGDLSVEDDIKIPVVLLFNLEVQKLLNHHFKKPVVIRLGKNPINPALIITEYFKGTRKFEADITLPVANQMLTLDAKKETMRINFRFNGINKESKPDEKQKAVGDNVELLSSHIAFINPADFKNFINHIRKIAYSLLGFEAVGDNVELLSSHIAFINPADFKNFINHIRKIAYSLLGFEVELDEKELKQIKDLISRVIVHQDDDIPKTIST